MVTGCTVADVIEAAHISPFRGVEDDNPENGLLLRADIHTLFDRHMVAVHPDTLHVELHPGVATQYGNTCETSLLLLGAARPGRAALDLHYERFQVRLTRPAA